MRLLMILATAVSAVVLQSGVYTRDGDTGDSLIDSSSLQPVLRPSRWQAPLPTPSGMISQRANSFTCSGDASGPFEIEVQNLTSSTKHKRQSGTVLTITLVGSVMKDLQNRTGYIASNHQFQFDSPPQAGALLTDGFSVCSNGSLTHELLSIWWQCLSGDFYNLYDEEISNSTCSPIEIVVLGALPIIGSAITSSASSVPTSTGTTSPTSEVSRSSSPTSSIAHASASSAPTLTTGDKAAIGVAVPVGVLAIASALFLIWRRRRQPRPASQAETTEATEWEKPELQDNYDASIAGPVRKKPELEARGRHISELPDSGTDHIASHEIAAADMTTKSNEMQGSSTSHTSTTLNNPSSTTANRPTRKPLPVSSTAISDLKPQPPAKAPKAENHDELTEEFDTLISEIGVISKRKRALNSAAAAAGVQPEDLQGRRGTEYQQLTQREEGVRARMAEVQNALEMKEG